MKNDIVVKKAEEDFAAALEEAVDDAAVDVIAGEITQANIDLRASLETDIDETTREANSNILSASDELKQKGLKRIT